MERDLKNNSKNLADNNSAEHKKFFGVGMMFFVLLALSFFINPSSASAASRYWVGGTGSWSAANTANWSATSGGAGGASVPTSADDCFFDSNSNIPGSGGSYTVTHGGTANCLDISFANPASGALTWAGSSAMSIYGSFTILSTITRTYTGAITFRATTTGKTITLNGITLAGGMTFNGIGGGWTLQDALTITAGQNLTLSNGSLNTNGQTITCNGIVSAGSATRSLTLGASTINSSFWIFVSTGMTLSALSSTINFLGSTFDGAGLTYGTVNLTNAAPNITGANTFTTLNFAPITPAKTNSLSLSDNQIVTGTFTVSSGATATNRVYIKSSVLGTPRTITAGATAISNADFQDIVGAGVASWDLSGATGGSGDAGGNSGITFTTPVDQHWVSASGGNWSDITKWTSRVPLPQDNVFMDRAFGTSQTVTADMPRLGKSIDWTGATWTTNLTWTASTPASIFGSLTILSGLTMNSAQVLTFEGRGNFTITGNGATIEVPINLDAATGTLMLGGNLTLGATRRLTIQSGTFSAVNGGNNYVISPGLLSLTGGTLTLGSATHLVTGVGATTWDVTGGTLNADTSTIKFISTVANGVTFRGGGKTYNIVWYDRGNSVNTFQIVDSNTFAELKDTGTAAHQITFHGGNSQTITTWSISGTPGNLISLRVSPTNVTNLLVKAGGGIVSADYLDIGRSVATPGSTWYAGANSVNNQNVLTPFGSGWIFTDPPDTGAPTITSISSLKADGTYTVGEVIDINVTFSEAVTSTGNVTVTLETGATDQTCTFAISNTTTGTCDYTVQAGDTTSDLDATISGTISDQSANVLTDFVPATSLATNKEIVIDAVNPTVSSLSPSDNATGVSTTANLVLTFDEAVTVNTGNVTIKRTSDDSTIETIDVTSGQVTGSGTPTITVNPSVTFVSFTEYYVEVASTAFRDVVLNNYAGISNTTDWSFVIADIDVPTITNISSLKADGTYTVGEVIDIDVTFSEAVTSTGNITVTLETGTTDRTCTFTITNATTGTCDYTVQEGDTTSDLDATISGTIADQSANVLTDFVPATSLANNKAIVIDTTTPNITNISSLKADGTYTTGEVIDINVTFSEAVTSTGNVTVTLETGATDQTCTFAISNTTTGTCDYTVQAGDTTSDLDATISGTIADQSANVLTDFVPATSLAANKEIVIDTAPPPEVTEVTNEPTENRRISSSGSSPQSRINNLASQDSPEALANYVNQNRDLLLALQAQGQQFLPEVIALLGVTNVPPVPTCPLGSDCSVTGGTSSPTSFTRDLDIGDTGEDIRTLQVYLNTHGFLLATSGLGSPGNETTVFGPLTKQALVKFQVAHYIYPPYGYFGPITKAFIARNP